MYSAVCAFAGGAAVVETEISNRIGITKSIILAILIPPKPSSTCICVPSYSLICSSTVLEHNVTCSSISVTTINTFYATPIPCAIHLPYNACIWKEAVVFKEGNTSLSIFCTGVFPRMPMPVEDEHLP